MLNTKSKELLVEAREHLKLADTRQTLADSSKWDAASLIWKAYKEENATQVEIAGMVGVSQKTVSNYVRMVEMYPEKEDRPPFTEAYYAVAGGSPMEKETQVLKRVAEKNPEKIAAIVASQPRVAKAIARNPATKDSLERGKTEVMLEQMTKDAKVERENIKKLFAAKVNEPPIGGRTFNFLGDMSLAEGKLTNLTDLIILSWKDEAPLASEEDQAIAKESMIQAYTECLRRFLEATKGVPDFQEA